MHVLIDLLAYSDLLTLTNLGANPPVFEKLSSKIEL
jgi:hypothetical protein